MTSLRLQRFDERWLPELMQWFPDADACRVWGGPSFRHPFTYETFRADMRMDELSSWALTEAGRLVGFGQYYRRVDHCHLGRLAIAPDDRGRGLGRTLVRELCRIGSAELGIDTYSLFVMTGNERARKLYGRLGFAATPYPEAAPAFEGMTYMVATRLD